MLLTLLCGAALAGDLVVDAAVPVEVRSQGAALVSVLSHARVRVLDLPPGSQSIELSRDGKVQTVTVSIPDQGAASTASRCGALRPAISASPRSSTVSGSSPGAAYTPSCWRGSRPAPGSFSFARRTC